MKRHWAHYETTHSLKTIMKKEFYGKKITTTRFNGFGSYQGNEDSSEEDIVVAITKPLGTEITYVKNINPCHNSSREPRPTELVAAM